jgi:peptide/nickel transport system ATP-binding protein
MSHNGENLHAIDRAPILRVDGLRVAYTSGRSLLRRGTSFTAVDDVTFDLYAGETLALVGESGSGKSTIARAILRVVEAAAGSIRYMPQAGPTIDVGGASAVALRQLRKDIRMVFQDPFSSLNPRMTVFDIIAEPLRNYGIARAAELRDRVEELIRVVGLRPADLGRYPHAFSGGQRQRIGLLRALSLDPQIILADEPTSALDVSVQAQVLNLMQRVQDERRLSYLFITHDLHVVRHVSDRCAVLYLGNVVETGSTKQLFERPSHPYTRALLASVPVSHPKHRRRRLPISSEIPDPAHRPGGCAFHPRCAFAQDICRTTKPAMVTVGDRAGHTSACHFANELPEIGEEAVHVA